MEYHIILFTKERINEIRKRQENVINISNKSLIKIVNNNNIYKSAVDLNTRNPSPIHELAIILKIQNNKIIYRIECKNIKSTIISNKE